MVLVLKAIMDATFCTLCIYFLLALGIVTRQHDKLFSEIKGTRQQLGKISDAICMPPISTL